MAKTRLEHEIKHGKMFGHKEKLQSVTLLCPNYHNDKVQAERRGQRNLYRITENLLLRFVLGTFVLLCVLFLLSLNLLWYVFGVLI